MNILLLILGVLAVLVGLGCWIYIVVDAFRDELWKGIVGLLCGFYLLYYMFFEFEDDNKWLFIIGALGGNCVASGIWSQMR